MQRYEAAWEEDGKTRAKKYQEHRKKQLRKPRNKRVPFRDAELPSSIIMDAHLQMLRWVGKTKKTHLPMDQAMGLACRAVVGEYGNADPSNPLVRKRAKKVLAFLRRIGVARSRKGSIEILYATFRCASGDIRTVEGAKR